VFVWASRRSISVCQHRVVMCPEARLRFFRKGVATLCVGLLVSCRTSSRGSTSLDSGSCVFVAKIGYYKKSTCPEDLSSSRPNTHCYLLPALPRSPNVIHAIFEGEIITASLCSSIRHFSFFYFPTSTHACGFH
jgi:hypothetical protein